MDNPFRLFLGASLLLFAAFALPAPASGAAYSCFDNPPSPPNATAFPVPVTGTMSWFGPGLLCAGAPDFVSVAPACSTAVGPAPGAYCGPTIPAFGFATCAWATTGLTTFPTGLVVGFDATGDGHVFASDGELPVTKPLAPGSWTIPNPYAVAARVIAYPTSLVGEPNPSPPWSGVAPGEVNLVQCV